ncbi:Serine/threonine exchanger SteT [Enhygromyxa salina]|uniref:Serine/threonine exchanger SteT n=1 Tax=Enhygromyxa salina TaxID=215803 RepID=A0A2S9XXE4_9BACT|nr:amino acid permease [Enhygromyxa salina]PRP97547.1 Serine/threonine exchanger SteT [Enhygromyxa salina]
MTDAPKDSRQQRKLTALPAVALVAGSMLGIGIFIMPGQVAANVGGPWSFLAMWIVGGLAALFGALCLAELGAMRPRSGGDYEFLHIGWGHGIAFAAGWLQLLVIFPGSLASVAVATSNFQLPVLLGDWAGGDLAVLGLTIPAPRLTAAALILGLTLINHFGVRIAGWVQVTVTVVPILVLLLVSVYVLGDSGASEALREGTTATPKGDGGGGLSTLGHAYLKVYFAYSGWNAALYVAGEIDKPGRNLPRALVGGTALVTALYVLLCLGFLAVFGFAALPEVGEAGTAAAVELFGPAAVTAMALLILLAMIGSLNGTVLIGSRIAYAMSKRGDCVKSAGTLHPRHGTPHIALWLQALIALALIASPFNLDQLIDYTSSAMLITGTLTVLSVIVLRRKMPDAPRPYKTTFHPLPAIGYALSSLVVFVLVVIDRDPSVLVTVAWFGGALLFWRLFVKKRGVESSDD